MLVTGRRNVSVEIGDFVVIPHEHFHFHLRFMFDRLSVPFTILSFVLVGTIGAFANRYLHREPGFLRFFLLYAMFLLGMTVASLAGTIETLFFGWELVGLSSALLVAYFQDRSFSRLQRATGVVGLSGGGCRVLDRRSDSASPDGSGRFCGPDGPGVLASRRSGPDGERGPICRPVAAGRRGRQVSADPVFGMAAAGDGRADAFECRFLRSAFSSPRNVSLTASQPAARFVDSAERDRRRARPGIGDSWGPGRTRSDRREKCAWPLLR